jgi:hypothetical protein
MIPVSEKYCGKYVHADIFLIEKQDTAYNGAKIMPASRGRGRPRKYGRPSRAVTLTLPEDTLAQLAVVDADVGRAIVRMVDRRPAADRHAFEPAEVSKYGNHAVIVVAPIQALKRLRGVELVPVGNGRSLISLAQGHTVSQLELDLRDALDRGVAARERAALETIARILREARSAGGVRVEERTIIVLATKRRRG